MQYAAFVHIWFLTFYVLLVLRNAEHTLDMAEQNCRPYSVDALWFCRILPFRIDGKIRYSQGDRDLHVESAIYAINKIKTDFVVSFFYWKKEEKKNRSGNEVFTAFFDSNAFTHLFIFLTFLSDERPPSGKMMKTSLRKMDICCAKTKSFFGILFFWCTQTRIARTDVTCGTRVKCNSIVARSILLKWTWNRVSQFRSDVLSRQQPK